MTLQLETGRWYRRKSGQLAYVIGPAIPPCSQNAKWLIQVDDMQTIVTAYDGGKFYCSTDEIVEMLPDCTGWDCQPPEPEPKSLGEKLCDAGLGECWAFSSNAGRAAYQQRAETFLRSVLTPPPGKTLFDIWLKSGKHDTSSDTDLRLFLESLTGIKMSCVRGVSGDAGGEMKFGSLFAGGGPGELNT